MNETSFDKKIHNDFKAVFADLLLKVSTNYVDSLKVLDNHLNAIYGVTMNRAKILDDYLNSSVEVLTIDDIEEVSEDFIRALVTNEDEYSSKIARLQEIGKILSQSDLQLDEEKIKLLQEAIDIIGLTGQEDSLLSEIISKDATIVENPKPFRNLISALLMITNEVSNLFSSGIQLSFPNTKFVAMTQTKGRCFYRGENAYYKTSKAGCFRGKSWSELKESVFEHALWNLRLYECFDFFDNFDVVKQWAYSEVNYLALAQHYGLRTQMLDITTSLKTALFFACCKADKNGLDWHPLTKADFEKVDSRKNVVALGGDSRYAVLHYVPTNIVDCQWLSMDEGNTNGVITPIGYQPFMRCSTQYGYMMLTSEGYDLMKDKLFKKVRFKLTEDFCNWIYEEMKGGKLIYPNDEDIARIQDIVRIVSGMNSRTEFSRFVAENVRIDIGAMSELDRVNYYLMLKRKGIKIKDTVEVMSAKNIEKINKRYTLDKVESMLEKPKCKPMFVIG
jgi:endonuclease III-like uncharacterized protein